MTAIPTKYYARGALYVVRDTDTYKYLHTQILTYTHYTHRHLVVIADNYLKLALLSHFSGILIILLIEIYK